MKKVTEIVWELAEPVVRAAGCALWDVEYVREGGEWFLRIIIDKEGGVSIDDCETVSRAVDPLLDERDPVPDSYILEVSSAGLERELRRPEHYAAYLGAEVSVRLFAPRQGARELVGTLAGYEPDGTVLLQMGEESLRLGKKERAMVRLHADF